MLDRLRRLRPGTPLRRILFYEVCRLPTLAFFTLVYRYRAIGARRVPAEGAVLLVANHQSFLDPPGIGLGIRHRQVDYIARVGLFVNPVFAWLIRSLNALPINEEGSDAAAIKEILRRLGDGRVVLIFPEGSRSPEGAMHEFKRGIAVLVKRAKCPVVPVAIEGAFDAWPRTRKLPAVWGKRVAVKYGEPIAHEELMREGGDAALSLLFDRVQGMRMELRAMMREESQGRYPRPGEGDRTEALAGE